MQKPEARGVIVLFHPETVLLRLKFSQLEMLLPLLTIMFLCLLLISFKQVNKFLQAILMELVH
nr:MAG TPA: hypothetical protein [Caudoviricetes sp.]